MRWGYFQTELLTAASWKLHAYSNIKTLTILHDPEGGAKGATLIIANAGGGKILIRDDGGSGVWNKSDAPTFMRQGPIPWRNLSRRRRKKREEFGKIPKTDKRDASSEDRKHVSTRAEYASKKHRF